MKLTLNIDGFNSLSWDPKPIKVLHELHRMFRQCSTPGTQLAGYNTKLLPDLSIVDLRTSKHSDVSVFSELRWDKDVLESKIKTSPYLKNCARITELNLQRVAELGRQRNRKGRKFLQCSKHKILQLLLLLHGHPLSSPYFTKFLYHTETRQNHVLNLIVVIYDLSYMVCGIQLRI